jgi:hypothetical protein
MDKKKELEFIETIQQTVNQMKEDDLNEYGDDALETFDCSCCGGDKILAGSLFYDGKKLCNDCVLLAEISFGLKKIEHIDELLNQMEEKRLENLCEYIKKDKNALNN